MNPDMNPTSRRTEMWNISSNPVAPDFEAKVGQVFLIHDGHHMISRYEREYYLVHLETGKIVDAGSIQALVRTYGLSEKNLRKNLTFC